MELSLSTLKSLRPTSRKHAVILGAAGLVAGLATTGIALDQKSQRDREDEHRRMEEQYAEAQRVRHQRRHRYHEHASLFEPDAFFDWALLPVMGVGFAVVATFFFLLVLPPAPPPVAQNPRAIDYAQSQGTLESFSPVEFLFGDPQEDVPEETVPEVASQPSAAVEPDAPSTSGASVGTLLAYFLGIPGGLLLMVASWLLGSRIVSRYRERREEKIERARQREARLHAARVRQEELSQAYTSYLFDVCAVVRRPALNDLEVPQTQEFTQAYQDLMHLGTDNDATDIEHFENLLSRAESAWRRADAHASRVASSYLGLEEQKRLSQAEQLLKLALSEGATPPERKLAYERAMTLLQGLMMLHEPARTALEGQVRLMLESTPTTPASRAASPVFLRPLQRLWDRYSVGA